MTPRITMTGADERTPLDYLMWLGDVGIEIGLLFTMTPEGRNRYPGWDWLNRTVAALGKRAAIHVCGRCARNAMTGLLWQTLRHVGRIQVNGELTRIEVENFCSWFQGQTVITQHKGGHGRHLVDAKATNHALLVDASGGQGKLPEKWERPETMKDVGFAGGLGPDTLAEQLPKIEAVAGIGPWWIDMEGGLRDEEDWFDVRRATQVLRVLKEFDIIPPEVVT